jgi:hypothetical protein
MNDVAVCGGIVTSSSVPEVNDVLQGLFNGLMDRMTRVYEFPEVRKLSAEIAAR